MMTLEDLSNLKEIIPLVGVIASLVFVGLQMRQSTIATKAQIHNNITSGYISFAEVLMPHAETFSKGISEYGDQFDTLSAEEKLIYFSLILCLFKHYENMHSQYQSGLIDKETWRAWSVHLRMCFHQPGVQLWWSQRKMSFARSFRIFLETSSIPSDTPSIVDLMDRSSLQLAANMARHRN